MREIKAEVEDKYNSDAIKVAEEAIIPVEETLTKLYSVKKDKMFTPDELASYKAQCEICVSAVRKLKDAGYGDSYKDRYHKALLYALKLCGAEAKTIKVDSTITLTTLTDEYTAKARAVNDYAVYINKTLEKSKVVDQTEVSNNVDLAAEAWDKVNDVEIVRQENIDAANKQLEDAWLKLRPMSDIVKNMLGGQAYDDMITEAYKKCLAQIDEVNKYHGTPTYTKDEVKEEYKKCAVDMVKSLNEKLTTDYGKLEVKTDLVKNLAKAESKYLAAQKKYQESGGSSTNEAEYKEAKQEFEKLEQEFNNHAKYMEKIADGCDAYIDKITEAGGKPDYTHDQIEERYQECTTRDLNENKDAPVKNTGYTRESQKKKNDTGNTNNTGN